MIYRCVRARILVVILQLLFLSLPVFADFNPTNPPEPNITKPVMVGVYPVEAGWAYGEGNYREGSNVYIETYSYRDDYKFLYWTINGYVYNYNTSFNYTMGDSAVVFIANYEYVAPTPPPFEPINPPEPYVKQNITVELDPDEGGYTEGSGSYTTGDYIWIAANLETNYELEYWTINGYPWHETNNAFSYVVGDTNAHFVAHIAEKSLLTLRTQPRAAGTSTMAINGNQFTDMLVASGKVIDFNTIGNEEYTFSHWTINGYVQSTSTSFQYTMGDSAASVVAVYDYIGVGDTTLFNPDSPPEPDLREEITIIVQSADESKGTVAGGGTYLYGTIDTLYAYPNEGFAFRRWNDSVTDNPRIIQATQDSVFIAYFGNDTAVWNDTICYGDTLHVGDTIFYESGHYEFYSLRSDGYFTWNIVDLNVWHQMSTSLQATICAGDTFSIGEIEYTESGTYLCTLQNDLGCDSTVTLTLNVLPQVESKEEYVTICYGETYTWAENGKTYTQSTTDSIVYTTIHGCDSIVTLNLTILPPVDNTIITDTICSGNSYTWSANGKTYFTDAVDTVILSDRNGCDSVLILQLTQVAKIETVFSDTICYGDTLVWNVNGQEYTTSAVDSIILPSSQGCDSIVKLNLTVLPEISETVYTDTICEGNAYIWSVTGQTYTTTTDTSVVLTSINGCDSIVRLQLYARPIQKTIITDTICYGDTYTWSVDGQTYSTTTIAKDTFMNVNGCDSIIELHLTVLPAVLPTVDSAVVAFGETYTWHDEVYNTSGDYTLTLQDTHGCDSVLVLHLIVLPKVPVTEDSAIICAGESYTWQGGEYAATGDYSLTLQDSLGYDSILILHLSVMEPIYTNLYDTACGSYTWINSGITYTQSGIYTDSLLSMYGCDSIVTLHLTINHSTIGEPEHITICYGASYLWNGTSYDTAGEYSTTLVNAAGCDSVATLHLTVLPESPITEEYATITKDYSYHWNGTSYTDAGDYTVTLADSNGCDSVVVLHLMVADTDFSVVTYEQCADDPMIEFEMHNHASFKYFYLRWDESAHAQQLHDTIVEVFNDYISIPNTARAGVYNVEISALVNKTQYVTQSNTITLLYPSSVLDQHWDDFIGVLTHDYNGGYDFVSFQWYKNNEPIPGENRSYIATSLEMGASYSALLEDANGVKLMTCPIIARHKEELSLYPSLLSPRQTMHLHSSHYATILFYTLNGDLIFSTEEEAGEILLQAPERGGLYIVQVIYHNNQNQVLTRKITVR